MESRDIKLYELPATFLVDLAANYLSVQDILALVEVNREMRAIFSHRLGYIPLWRRLNLRDLGMPPAGNDQPDSFYDFYEVYYPERQRLISYALVWFSSQWRPPVDIMKFFLHRLDLPAKDPMVILSRPLKFHQYKSFHDLAAKQIAALGSDDWQARRQRLEVAYHQLFLAPATAVNEHVSDIMETMNGVLLRNDPIDKMSSVSDSLVLLSALAKCGATHSLQVLLAKLDDETREDFIVAAGSNLCRDAAMFAHPEILDQLLLKDARLGLSGVCAEWPAVYSSLFNETELVPLRAGMTSLMQMCLSSYPQPLDHESREALLRSFAACMDLLCRHVHAPYQESVLATARLHLKTYNGHHLVQEDDRVMVTQIFADIIQSIKASLLISEPEEGTKKVRTSGGKQARDEFEDDELADIINKSMQSPEKRGRTDEGGMIEWALSPGSPDDGLDELVAGVDHLTISQPASGREESSDDEAPVVRSAKRRLSFTK